MFRVGQKVVCTTIDRLKDNMYGWEILPEKDGVYTIRELLVIEGKPLMRLMEVHNEVGDYSFGLYECAFNRRRFRPIVERKTDISFAHEILRSVSEPAHSEAQS